MAKNPWSEGSAEGWTTWRDVGSPCGYSGQHPDSRAGCGVVRIKDPHTSSENNHSQVSWGSAHLPKLGLCEHAQEHSDLHHTFRLADAQSSCPPGPAYWPEKQTTGMLAWGYLGWTWDMPTSWIAWPCYRDMLHDPTQVIWELDAGSHLCADFSINQEHRHLSSLLLMSPIYQLQITVILLLSKPISCKSVMFRLFLVSDFSRTP